MSNEWPSQFPLQEAKGYDESSIFSPESLLNEARRQKGLPNEDVPEICVLDPDGDILHHLRDRGEASELKSWPGYHTRLYTMERQGFEVGIIACAVGAPFAVLVAEQLFAAGCEFLISITSSGQILPRGEPPYFVLIEQALRDEGTSYHYQEPTRYASLDHHLQDRVEKACTDVSQPVYTGATWTTDAPFRETERAIERARNDEILAVEMEAAALYTFATVHDQPVVCFAHVTNQMGQAEEDFEKGEAAGSMAALDVIDANVELWRKDSL